MPDLLLYVLTAAIPVIAIIATRSTSTAGATRSISPWPNGWK
jgi:hypothetical protein